MLQLKHRAADRRMRSQSIPLCAICALCFIVGSPVRSLAGSPVPAPPASPTPPTASSTPPSTAITTIIIAERRTASEAARKDVVNSLMKEDMNNVFKDSGLYTVEMFSPSMSFLKQALLAHSLDSSDLDEPVKASSLHKVARLFGARNIVTFHAVLDKTGIKTDVTFEELAAQDTWRQTITNSYSTPTVIGRRKLKVEEMVLVNVDAIARSLSVPSHLLDDMHLELAAAGATHSTPATKQATTNSDATTQSNTGAAGAQSQTTGTDDGNPTSQGPITPPPTTKPGKTKKQQALDLQSFTAIPEPTEPTVLEGARPIPSRLSQPEIRETISNEERAQRFRTSGDLASAILYLRRAVDDKPDDIDLRRKLIKAYQDDNASEMAVAEIGRSLRLDNKNSALYRMYGDAEYASGNSAEAMKAYKQAMDLDPKDVLARIALADMLQHDGQYGAAQQLYGDAVVSAPTSPIPHRRLALAACQRASSDPDQYAQALSEIKKARALTAPIDTQSYLDDYSALMKIMESRVMDILEQLDNTYAAFARGQSSGVATNRLLKDMSERASAASDFLDALPVSAGQEGTHALYQEGTASLLSSISYLKSFVEKGDTQFETKLNTEKMSARHDLTEAGKRLRHAKPAAQ